MDNKLNVNYNCYNCEDCIIITANNNNIKYDIPEKYCRAKSKSIENVLYDCEKFIYRKQKILCFPDFNKVGILNKGLDKLCNFLDKLYNLSINKNNVKKIKYEECKECQNFVNDNCIIKSILE